MEKRTFGRTGYLSTVVTFGTAALSSVNQESADQAVGLAGKMLTPVVHTNSFWFAVGAFKPDTKIYQGAG